jgi:hypothetical protein
MFLLVIARFESTSIRVEHESVGTEERPSKEPAVARCLHPPRDGSLCAILHKEKRIFTALKLPSDPAPEVANSQRSGGQASERDPDEKFVIPGRSSSPLNTAVRRTRLFERPDGSSQAHHCPRL